MLHRGKPASAAAALLLAAVLGVAGCSQGTPGPYTRFEGQRPDGTVDMNEVQAAYIGSAGGGSGTLFYRAAFRKKIYRSIDELQADLDFLDHRLQ